MGLHGLLQGSLLLLTAQKTKWCSVNDERATNKSLNTLRGPIAELFNVQGADTYTAAKGLHTITFAL
jgi:hypothetical protein